MNIQPIPTPYTGPYAPTFYSPCQQRGPTTVLRFKQLCHSGQEPFTNWLWEKQTLPSPNLNSAAWGLVRLADMPTSHPNLTEAALGRSLMLKPFGSCMASLPESPLVAVFSYHWHSPGIRGNRRTLGLTPSHPQGSPSGLARRRGWSGTDGPNNQTYKKKGRLVHVTD